LAHSARQGEGHAALHGGQHSGARRSALRLLRAQRVAPATNLCLPAIEVGSTIAVWWDDLNPAGAGVWARTGGAAPNRQFEVQWKAAHPNGGGAVDVRVRLQEGSNEIDFCYIDTTTGDANEEGASATAGVQVNNRLALEYSCFSSSLTEDKVVRFIAP